MARVSPSLWLVPAQGWKTQITAREGEREGETLSSMLLVSGWAAVSTKRPVKPLKTSARPGVALPLPASPSAGSPTCRGRGCCVADKRGKKKREKRQEAEQRHPPEPRAAGGQLRPRRVGAEGRSSSRGVHKGFNCSGGKHTMW